MANKLNKDNVQNILRLTSLQEGMLFHYLENPSAEHYFEQLSIKLIGKINPEIFIQAWNHVVKNNEMLRVVFRWKNIEHPVQIILKEHSPEINIFDLSEKDQENPDLYHKVLDEDKYRKIDLEQVPFRITLCPLCKNSYYMLLTNHHIIYDGWSIGIILKEFLINYNLLCDGKEVFIAPKNNYTSYIKYLNEKKMAKNNEFWEKYLKGFNTTTNLPVKSVIKNDISFYDNYKIVLSHDKVKTFCSKNDITVASLLYTAWGILLQKYNNNNDVIFGITLSGRNNIRNVDNIVGLFINTIPIRIQSTRKESFIDLLKKVNIDVNDIREHQETSLLKLKQFLDLKTNNIFDSILVMENYPIDKILKSHKHKYLNIDSYEHQESTSYLLTVSIKPDEQLYINLNFNKAFFNKDIIRRLSNHFINIVNFMISKSTKEILHLNMLSEDEYKKLVYEFNKDKLKLPNDKTVVDLVEEQAVKSPNKIAIRYNDINISYKEMNEKANQLAIYFHNNGLVKDQLVCIMLDRSPIMIIAILAIWKAGCAYIPLNPKDPSNRIIDILADVLPKILLTNEDFFTGGIKDNYNGDVILIDDIDSLISDFPVDNLFLDIANSALAYIIFTSGSTGKPKGAMIEHIGMLNHMLVKQDILDINNESIIAQNASHTFDISVWQSFIGIISGGITVIYDNIHINNIESFINSIKKDKITILEVVPSYLALMLEYMEQSDINIRNLKYLIATGEELKFNLVKKWFEFNPEIKIVNAYGPTEASDDITHNIIDVPPDDQRIHIGKPIANMNIFIVDRDMNLCPMGVRGEICVTGIGVGRGYLNDSIKTNQSFVKNPFDSNSKYLLYKTGDLGAWNEDGNISFFGRIDTQVKIRGFRIELGEIERVMLNYNGVKEAVVINYEDKNKDTKLCGYLTLQSNIDLNDLKVHLKDNLPDYMIPQDLIVIKEFILTTNGKIDRKALKGPDNKKKITYIGCKFNSTQFF